MPAVEQSLALDVASVSDEDADAPDELAPPAAASQRLAGPGDVLMVQCRTADCRPAHPGHHGGNGKKGQWKCGRCQTTAYCLQCTKGGKACAVLGTCIAILDPKLLGR